MKRRSRTVSLLWLSVLLAACILFGMQRCSVLIAQRTLSERRLNLENAVEKGITGCYALEGRYPPSIEYLEKSYGLIYDRETFYVDYRPIGANIRPDFYVLTLTAASEDAE